MITDISPLLEPGATVVAAPYAPAGQIISGTSATALSIPLTPPYPVYVWQIVETNIGFRVGMRVRAAAVDVSAGVTTWIEGIVTAWDETNLTVQIDLVSGLGMHAAWNINVTGQPGLTGPKGDPGATGAIGPAWGTAGTGTSIDSPVFTGQPTSAFTPGQGTPHANDATLATTQFVSTTVNFALNNTALLGNPTAPTPATGDSDTSIATTAFVARDFAPINNPILTGNPQAPTPAAGDSDKSIATTEFVATSFAPINNPIFTGDARLSVTPVATDNDTSIATTAFVHTAVAPLAPINSPAFGGTPTAITPGVGSNDTSLATTAFVGTAIQPLATLITPHFTGTPSAPTPPAASTDGSIATTQFVKTAILPLATLKDPYFIGLPTAPTQPAATSDGTLATTQFVHNGFQPLSADLSALASVTGAGVMYYRSSAGAWQPVQMGANMTFSGGTLASAGGGGGTGTIAEAPNDGTYYARRNLTWAANAIQVDAPSDTSPYVRLNATWTIASAAGLAMLAAPAFTGVPTAPTVSPSTDNSTKLANTAFVQSVLLNYALLAGPNFSGVPTAPTPAAISNDTTLATTQFVKTAISTLAPLAGPVFTGDARAVTPLAGDNDTSIATTQFVQTAISGKADSSAVAATYAPLAAPTFTGDAKAVTPATGDNDTSIATTQFVARDFAPLASPTLSNATLTGTPTSTTPAPGDNSTRIATSAFVQNAISADLKANVTATITVGYTFTPYNGGTVSTGTFTPSAANGNYQYYTNGGAHTLAAPAADCAVDIMVTNAASGAGAITFTGFTFATGNTGDALTTVANAKFIVSIRRINAITTYAIKALQ